MAKRPITAVTQTADSMTDRPKDVLLKSLYRKREKVIKVCHEKQKSAETNA